MAGTLLLIKKEGMSSAVFDTLAANVKKKTLDVYTPYYDHIDTHQQADSLWMSFYKEKEDKSYVAEDGSRLVYEGVVFALNETKRYSAKELWELYKNQGFDFINACDGQFVIKVYDKASAAYHVFTDIIKSHTNYLVESDGAVMFSPFVIITAALCQPKLDVEAFNEYMWRYYVVSNKTLFEGVSKIKPASHYSFQDSKIVCETYWCWPKQFTTKSFDECVSTAAESMKETARLIDKTFRNPCIDFTMGQDSRQVVSSFVNQDLPFNTSLFGKKTFQEVKEVEKTTKRYGISFNNIQLEDDYASHFSEYLNDVVRVGSAEEPVYLLARLNYMRSKQMELAPVAMNGCDGHFYKNGLWDELYTFNLYREPKAFNADLFIKMRALSKNYADSMFNDKLKAVKQNSKAYYKSIIAEAIKGYEDSPVSIQVDRFDLYHWLNFLIAATQSANKKGYLFSPLLFRRNLELALQIPVKWKWNLSRFQRAIVWNLSEALASEKTDFGGVTMKPLNKLTQLPFLVRYFWFQSKRLRDKVKTKMGLKVVTHLQEAWDYLPLYKEAFKTADMQEVINQDWAISDVLDKEGFEAYMKRFDNLDECKLSDFEHFYKMLSVDCLMREAKSFSEFK